MHFISSDTNVWIDFVTIQKTEIPFRLPYTYIMSCDAVNEELLSPPGLGQQLTSYGLVPVEITEEEFFLGKWSEMGGCVWLGRRRSPFSYTCIRLAHRAL